MDRAEAYAEPYAWIKKNKTNLNMTDKGEKSYWHFAITTLDDGGLAINTSKVGIKTPLEQYRFTLGTGKAVIASAR